MEKMIGTQASVMGLWEVFQKRQHNIYILTKEENEKLWCQCCFEELWKEYSINGWTGDDIEYYLELENEENEEKETS